MATPTRKTSEQQLNAWNQQWRSSPAYAEALRAVGADPNAPLNLTSQQQEQIERYMASIGQPVPKGMHVDKAGNLNQVNTLVGNSIKGAAIGGAALTGLGAFGIGPLSGLLGGLTAAGAGGTAAATGAAGAGAGAAGAGGAAGLGLLSGGVLPLGTGLGAAGAGMGAGGIGGILGGIGTAIKADPLGSLGKVGGLLGGASSGMAEGRRDDAYAQAAAGRVNQDAMAMDQKRSVLTSLLGGLQDAKVNRPMGSTIPDFSVSGGLRPSALSNRDALMQELSRKAPTIDPAKAGKAESILGGIGTGLGILGAFKPKAQVMY
jgi:hypothetical protein